MQTLAAASPVGEQKPETQMRNILLLILSLVLASCSQVNQVAVYSRSEERR